MSSVRRLHAVRVLLVIGCCCLAVPSPAAADYDPDSYWMQNCTVQSNIPVVDEIPASCVVRHASNKRWNIRPSDFAVHHVDECTETDGSCRSHFSISWQVKYALRKVSGGLNRTSYNRDSGPSSTSGYTLETYSGDDDDADEDNRHDDDDDDELSGDAAAAADDGVASGFSNDEDDFVTGFHLDLYPTTIFGIHKCVVVRPKSPLRLTAIQGQPLVVQYRYDCFKAISTDRVQGRRYLFMLFSRKENAEMFNTVIPTVGACNAVPSCSDVPSTSSNYSLATRPPKTTPVDRSYVLVIVVVLLCLGAAVAIVTISVIKYRKRRSEIESEARLDRGLLIGEPDSDSRSLHYDAVYGNDDSVHQPVGRTGGAGGRAVAAWNPPHAGHSSHTAVV